MIINTKVSSKEESLELVTDENNTYISSKSTIPELNHDEFKDDQELTAIITKLFNMADLNEENKKVFYVDSGPDKPKTTFTVDGEGIDIGYGTFDSYENAYDPGAGLMVDLLDCDTAEAFICELLSNEKSLNKLSLEMPREDYE